MGRKPYTLEEWKERLEENLTETGRQLGFLGERLGVTARLNALERERKRIARKLIEMDPDSRAKYLIHLYY